MTDYFIATENKLSGQIPSEIGQASSLLNLALDVNKLSGSIPTQIGLLNLLGSPTDPNADSPQQHGLQLQSNELTGNLPESLFSLVELRLLNVRSNSLNGTISTSIEQLENLISLNLADNKFNGAIPSELGSLANLDLLYIEENDFVGPVPDEVCSIDFTDSPITPYTFCSDCIICGCCDFCFSEADNICKAI